MNKSFKFMSRFFTLVVCCTILSAVLSACGYGERKENINNSSKKVEEQVNVKDIRLKEDGSKVYVCLKDAFNSVGNEYITKGSKAEIKSGMETLKVTERSKEIGTTFSKIIIPDEIINVNGELYASLESLKEIIDGRVCYSKDTKKVTIKPEMKLEYSKGFSVKYLKGGVKKITDGNNRILILIPREKEVSQAYKNENVVKIPVKDVLVSSSNHASFLKSLEEIPSLTAVALDSNRWNIDDIKKGIEEKRISNVCQGGNYDYNKIRVLNPEIAFTYNGEQAQADLMKRLGDIKIPYAVDNGYIEKDPLGKMEWIKFIAAFYDKEEVAEKVFNDAISNR
ncbi:hypothetical protein ACOAKC_00100 [Hathewaya histolytica]|uniref:hypothetical protein n=1 Tax=Hathewaya histolytica TaxID=1498 RepID=UPI003B67926F